MLLHLRLLLRRRSAESLLECITTECLLLLRARRVHGACLLSECAKRECARPLRRLLVLARSVPSSASASAARAAVLLEEETSSERASTERRVARWRLRRLLAKLALLLRLLRRLRLQTVSVQPWLLLLQQLLGRCGTPTRHRVR